MSKKVVGKVIYITLFLCCISCNKKISNQKYGNIFVQENINVLLDSLKMFDMNAYAKENNLKDVTIAKPIVQLKSTVFVDSLESQINNKYLSFNLKKEVLSGFKSDYEAYLVKNRVDEGNIFVVISNFAINDSTTTVDVKKSLGIGMTKDRYFFKKVKQKWVYTRKTNLRIG